MLLAGLLVVQLLPVIEQSDERGEAFETAPSGQPMMRSGKRSAQPALQEADSAASSLPPAPRLETRKPSTPTRMQTADEGLPNPVEQSGIPHDTATVSPETELEAIYRLIDAGQSKAARRRLERFRKTFPDYSVQGKLVRPLEQAGPSTNPQ